MNPTERQTPQQALKNLVERQRGQLVARLDRARRDGEFGASTTRDAVIDLADAGENQVQTDILLTALQLASGTLEDGEEALRRWEQGRYGICEECDEPIPEARLLAMPFARRCTRCEEARDRDHGRVLRSKAYGGPSDDR